MSKDTQQEFIKQVDKAEKLLSSGFSISNKKMEINGYVTRISYTFGQKGVVEFLCGPPEYHAEIFISVEGVDKNIDRYDLMKLMSISQIRSWVTKNRPDMSHGDKIRAEVDWLVLLIKEVVMLPEFKPLL
jgi:hypothetical protein